MKIVNYKQGILIIILLLAQAFLGYLTADKDFVSIFQGNKKIIWYLFLIIYYGVLLLITIWIVSFLTSLFYKIANKQKFNRTEVENKSVWLIILISYTHLLVLYINYFLYKGKESLLLFIIPIFVLFISIIKDEKIQGIKKIVATIPLIFYIGFDIISLYVLI